MGESTSDLTAMEYLNENGFVPTDDENPYAVGTYATGNKVRAIRNYGMNFPMSGGVPEPSKQLMINALNFSNMGYDLTGPQVHADGEIWSKVNFDIRKALSSKYDQRFAADDRPPVRLRERRVAPQSCPGNRRWSAARVRLVPPHADGAVHAPGTRCRAGRGPHALRRANQKELWLEFARHGFGRNATSTKPPPTPTPIRRRLRGDRDDSSDRDVHGAEAHRERAGQRPDLRRPLRGTLVAIADTNPRRRASTWTTLPVCARDVRVRRPAPGYGHGASASRSRGQERTITCGRRQLGVRHAGAVATATRAGRRPPRRSPSSRT